MYLIEVGISLQYRPPFEHLSEDTTNAPHVYSRGIFSQREKQFGRSIPASDDERSIISRSFTTAMTSLRWWVVVGSSQTEIGDLKYAMIVDEEICSLHIPM